GFAEIPESLLRAEVTYILEYKRRLTTGFTIFAVRKTAHWDVGWPPIFPWPFPEKEPQFCRPQGQ
ncbi:MAG: hypothetical protein M0009_16590, partial [Deltaproteobacteria bacterium]|nr:hypothetical protein [Deltaproteobacteria bacterium]